jgi:hypothetical protein
LLERRDWPLRLSAGDFDCAIARPGERHQRRDADEDVDDASNRVRSPELLAEDVGDEVELEESDKAPVDAADGDEDHREPGDGVDAVHCFLLIVVLAGVAADEETAIPG